MTRPTFLVIGAMKCGTTSLWRYLSAHPHVAMAEQKEVQFFSRNWDKGVGWYEDQFPSDPEAVAIGEASPSYAELHFFPEVPARIASIVPDARLVYLVRNPIERVRSHYLHNLDRGFEDQPLARAVWATPTYTGIGQYATHVDAYLAHFDRDQLLIVLSERLRDERETTIAEIAAFIGISPWAADIADEHGRTLTLRRRLRRDWHRRGPRAVGRSIVDHTRWQRMAKMSPTLRDELAEFFRPEVLRLREHLAPDFDGWGIA
ncbi:MAG: hypothetical protein QOI95_2491 [Acidimicrobiaceae bacterium]|jgi:hypothetical protein